MSVKDKAEQIPTTDKLRLAALSPHVLAARTSLRHVDYRQAERDCERLAAQIMQEYSAAVQSFTFSAIPRGGFIVLGILSYVLGLRAEQLLPETNPLQPLCIVDDCAITGARFANAVKSKQNQHVIFAHLYSNPMLRRCILEREKHVRHCFAAHDLEDNARPRFDSDTEYRSWQKRWKTRMGEDRYWLGHTALVSFSWSEPDYLLWNSLNKTVETGWRFTPPHLCLKNKWALGIPPTQECKTEFHLATDIIYGEYDGALWLANTNSREVYALKDTGAEMLLALLVCGSTDQAVRHLAPHYDVPEEAIRTDLQTFYQRLVEEKLITRTESQ